MGETKGGGSGQGLTVDAGAGDAKRPKQKAESGGLAGGAAQMLADITRRRKAMRDAQETHPEPPAGS